MTLPALAVESAINAADALLLDCALEEVIMWARPPGMFVPQLALAIDKARIVQARSRIPARERVAEWRERFEKEEG
ncbi:MAG: hypothetical protein KGL39_30400 [Patescibacteria group bacterium]|nr:hypothetical protein [Patescibacteria group bacterium]